MTEISGSHRSEPLQGEIVDATEKPKPEVVLRNRIAETLLGIAMYKYKTKALPLEPIHLVMKRAGLTDEILESVLSELERTFAKPAIENTEEL